MILLHSVKNAKTGKETRNPCRSPAELAKPRFSVLFYSRLVLYFWKGKRGAVRETASSKMAAGFAGDRLLLRGGNAGHGRLYCPLGAGALSCGMYGVRAARRTARRCGRCGVGPDAVPGLRPAGQYP